MNIRTELIDELKRVLGDEVHVIPYQDAADVLEGRTVMVKQHSISRLAEAPNAQIRIDYVITFISAAIDPAIAEADLDDWVPAALDDLRASWFGWTQGTKALYGHNQRCYDVDAYVNTEPEITPQEG